MKTKIISILVILTLFLNINSIFAQGQKKEVKIQIAIILDTSNSMDGLIEQAKSQLWKIVNEMALARYDGELPSLEIALFEYGNDGLAKKDGYMRMVSELTTDLDKISEDLFSLKTYGGYEYCGFAINKAVSDLKWSKSNDDLKIIFIAGNEEFTQGELPYTDACKLSISKGIIVNTIFCGSYDEGIRIKWKDGADLSDGKYMNIDQNQEIVQIESPYDEEIIELSDKLNTTYIGYGNTGKAKKERQLKQDNNAKGLGANTSVQRAVSKTRAVYKNADWDLVEAVEEGEADIKELKEEELPEEMQKMTVKEREKYIKEKQIERAEIQKQINKLNEKREKYVAKKRAEMSQDNTLDAVMLKTVREQAEKKDYQFKK